MALCCNDPPSESIALCKGCFVTMQCFETSRIDSQLSAKWNVRRPVARITCSGPGGAGGMTALWVSAATAADRCGAACVECRESPWWCGKVVFLPLLWRCDSPPPNGVGFVVEPLGPGCCVVVCAAAYEGTVKSLTPPARCALGTLSAANRSPARAITVSR
jgi:hypothetical protein